MSGQKVNCSTGTISVRNQIDGSELCVTRQMNNNNCPGTYIAAKATGSNYIGCFETIKLNSPTPLNNSPTPSNNSPTPSNNNTKSSICKNYIEVPKPNNNYNPPKNAGLSKSTINLCKKSVCRDNKNNIVLVSNNTLPSFVCPQ